MDGGSPDEVITGMEEGVSSLVENPDLDLIGNEDDWGRAVLNNEGPNYEGSHSPTMKATLADLSSPQRCFENSFLPVESVPNYDGTERATEGQRLLSKDYQAYEENRGIEGDNCTAQPGDKDYSYEMIVNDAPINQSVESPKVDKAESGEEENASAKFHFDEGEVNLEKNVGNMSRQTERNIDDISSVMAASENRGMVWENSSLHSPQRIQNASSPERQFSISAEKSQSPLSHSSPMQEQERLSSPTIIDKMSAPSPISSRRKRSRSPKKHEGGGERPRSHGRSSSAMHKSPPEKIERHDSRHRGGSPRHITQSPRRLDSPRRRGRSTSRSPARRRDSPGRRRDQLQRSRSRSPHAKDRHRRSPRRRPSPRRRSPPPSYSRRRSPRRHWSPPRNRNTGLGKPGNNLFVAGFSYAATERDLEKKFSRFGRVTDVRIVRDRRSGESRGFGFLSLEKDGDADAAIRAVDQTEWNGRILLVEKSKTPTR